MGLGIQGGGVGVARYFAKHGAKVLVTDLKNKEDLHPSIDELSEYENISYHLGGHIGDDFIHTDFVVKGPSVRWDDTYIDIAIQRRVPILMETTYFVQHTKALVIGVTGTRGKSTTSHFIYSTLNKFYKKGKIFISGNIPGSCAMELLENTGERDIVVLELSSWQLSGFHRARVSPHIAVFTNIYEDHLNHYKSMSDYIFDKTAIFTYQNPNDYFFTLSQTKDKLQSQGFNIPSKERLVNPKDFKGQLKNVRGAHNLENAALAQSVAELLLPQLDSSIISNHIGSLHAMRFRQEIVVQSDQVTIVNDSTSTTPISTITALKTFQDRKIVLILGGNSKNLEIKTLVDEIKRDRNRIEKIILLKGSLTDEIYVHLLAIQGLALSEIYEDFLLAVKNAARATQNSSAPVYLLFSPGATSFAQFKNEFNRGEKFSQIISDIMK